MFGPYLTRKQAQALGAAWFYGTPCKRASHAPYRYSRGGCIECARLSARAVVAMRPRRPRVPLSPCERETRRSKARQRYEAKRAADPAYRAKVATRNAARAQAKAAWQDENRERLNAMRRARHEARPERARTRRRRRRGRLKGAEGYFTEAQAAWLKILQGGRCAYCGDTGALQLDHKQALARGGPNWPINLQWLCAWHNASKAATHDRDYRRRHGIAAVTPWDAAARLCCLAD